MDDPSLTDRRRGLGRTASLVVLGALGGLCGFFTSGLVHYNWGDSEVVMIFYFIVGLTLAIERRIRFNEPAEQAEA